MSPDQTSDRLEQRKRELGRAVSALGDATDGFDLMRALEMQPRSVPELLERLGCSPDELWDVSIVLSAGGLIERFGDGWRLTTLGGELWRGMRPVLDRFCARRAETPP